MIFKRLDIENEITQKQFPELLGKVQEKVEIHYPDSFFCNPAEIEKKIQRSKKYEVKLAHFKYDLKDNIIHVHYQGILEITIKKEIEAFYLDSSFTYRLRQNEELEFFLTCTNRDLQVKKLSTKETLLEGYRNCLMNSYSFYSNNTFLFLGAFWPFEFPTEVNYFKLDLTEVTKTLYKIPFKTYPDEAKKLTASNSSVRKEAQQEIKKRKQHYEVYLPFALPYLEKELKEKQSNLLAIDFSQLIAKITQEWKKTKHA